MTHIQAEILVLTSPHSSIPGQQQLSDASSLIHCNISAVCMFLSILNYWTFFFFFLALGEHHSFIVGGFLKERSLAFLCCFGHFCCCDGSYSLWVWNWLGGGRSLKNCCINAGVFALYLSLYWTSHRNSQLLFLGHWLPFMFFVLHAFWGASRFSTCSSVCIRQPRKESDFFLCSTRRLNKKPDLISPAQC